MGMGDWQDVTCLPEAYDRHVRQTHVTCYQLACRGLWRLKPQQPALPSGRAELGSDWHSLL